MNWYKFVWYYSWIAPHALLAVLSLLMFRRRLHRSFPIFFLYTLYETFEFALLFAIRAAVPTQKIVYRDVFIATLAGSTALRFGVIQEVFNNVFHEYPRLETIATISMRWVTGLLLLAAIVVAVYSSGTTSDNLMAGVALLDRSVILIQAGLLLFLFLFSRVFGLSWRSYSFGIALGFGIFASTELAYWAVRLIDLTEHVKDLLDFLPTGSYHVSVLIWLGYLLTAEKPVVAGTYPVPEIDRWSGELERSQ
jgi:hypothetical protein